MYNRESELSDSLAHLKYKYLIFIPFRGKDPVVMTIKMLDLFVELAEMVGELMKKDFLIKNKSHSWKQDHTIVTSTDKKIQKFVIESVHGQFPHIHVVGEEGRDEIKNIDEMILVDPLDGTTAFFRGIPLFSFAISYLVKGIPQVAVIYAPILNMMWTAEKGNGAFLNNSPIHVSDHPTINKSGIAVVWWKGVKRNLNRVCDKLIDQGSLWMSQTSLAYHGALVATGNLDAAIAEPTHGWETAALHLIIEEAGGKITDLDGNPMKYGPNGEINGHIISNGLIHDQLIEIVQSCQ